MLKVFITGSSDGIGLFTAQKLIELGHEVVLHAKNQKRADETILKFQSNIKVLIADLSIIDEIKLLAKKVNDIGKIDVIIHNAGIFDTSYEDIFKINVLAPYILTAMIKKPKKLIYIASSMHSQGQIDLKNLAIKKGVNYSTSKLQVLMLGLFISRQWKDVDTFIVDPGWVKTKMANYNAPDNIEDGSQTQIWLASTDLKFSGKYFYHLQETIYSSKADDITVQNELIDIYEKVTGISFPRF